MLGYSIYSWFILPIALYVPKKEEADLFTMTFHVKADGFEEVEETFRIPELSQGISVKAVYGESPELQLGEITW